MSGIVEASISVDVVSERVEVESVVSLLSVDVEAAESLVVVEEVVVMMSVGLLSVVVGGRELVDVIEEAVRVVPSVIEPESVVVVMTE